MTPTPLFRAYSVAARLALPVFARRQMRKVLDAGMGTERAREKLGHASAPRPQGHVIWFHAASVGESKSVLALITELGERLPKAEFLITSGTPSSADMIARALPPRCRHHFAPLDAPAPVQRFLAHWKPDAAIFVESELWPQIIWQTFFAGVPMGLVNARFSESSLSRWAKRPKTAAMLLGCFRLILTQTDALTGQLVALGARPDAVRKGVDLKSLAPALSADRDLIVDMRTALNNRPVWVAASTHEGEEAEVLAAHKALLRDHPDLCLILAPRHTERGDEVASLITDHGWAAPRRSTGDLPRGPVFLADTMGELGSWYALATCVFLGGSLAAKGGHNPYEVAQAGLPVLTGPHVFNFADIYKAMIETGAARSVENAGALSAAIGDWLTQPEILGAARDAAIATVSGDQAALSSVAQSLCDSLDLDPDPHHG